MAINTWALAERFPRLKQAGLCHSVQNTVEEIAHDLDLPARRHPLPRRGCEPCRVLPFAGASGPRPLPDAARGLPRGRLPKPPLLMPRCWNKVRYEVMDHLGYFCTESSEHFAEYVPWFIKDGRDDLIEDFNIPLDEYPLRCVEQAAGWKAQAAALKAAPGIEVEKSHEFAAEMMNAIVTDTPYTAYANLPNSGQVPQLPMGAAVETPTLVDGQGCQPTTVTDIPPQLVALMRTQINVQELVVRALMEENMDHIYHAAYMDPHTAAELDCARSGV
jgi:alpha-galactosidase